MRSPSIALAWEIGQRNRGWIWLVIAMVFAGRISMANYRGRSIFTFPVQAAERRLREREGLVGIDDLSLRRVEREDGSLRVTFAAGAETHELRVHEEHGDLTRLTCNSESLERPPRYVVSPP